MRSPEIFSYSLTRPYPSNFTWIILSGGAVLTALFSFIAVASNAYQFASTYQTDPVSVIHAKEWFQKAPFSWLSNMKSTCDPTPLVVGGVYMTSNRGFRYTVDAMRPQGENHTDTLPSTPYLNSTLSDCQVSEITVDLARRDNSAKNYWAWGATQASAVARCVTTSWPDNGQIEVNFTTQLPAVLYSYQIIDNFYKQNTSGPSGVGYGVNILSSWYGQIGPAMGYSAPYSLDTQDSGRMYGAGVITLTRNGNVSNYTDPRFFQVSAMVSQDDGGLAWMHPPSTLQDWTNQWNGTTANDTFHLPNISIVLDAFSKTYYSLLLSDFGANDSTNALLSADGIQYLQSINNTFLADAELGNLDPTDNNYLSEAQAASQTGLVTNVFDPTKLQGKTLNATSPVTISAQYLCSTPRRKGGFSLFFSVLLADVVFLSACWNLFGLIATWSLKKKDPQLYYCRGCAQKSHQADIALSEGVGAASNASLSGIYKSVPTSYVAVDDMEQPLVRRNSNR